MVFYIFLIVVGFFSYLNENNFNNWEDDYPDNEIGPE